MMSKEKSTHWLFRFYSSRGTDRWHCAELPAGTTDKEALEEAKDWAERETDGTACHEYTVTCERVALPKTRREHLAKYKKVLDAHHKAQEAYRREFAIMLFFSARESNKRDAALLRAANH